MIVKQANIKYHFTVLSNENNKFDWKFCDKLEKNEIKKKH